ncbi:hypothetical protein AHAS_Ahas01G0294800 [Arachis hypogaea]
MKLIRGLLPTTFPNFPTDALSLRCQIFGSGASMLSENSASLTNLKNLLKIVLIRGDGSSLIGT